MCIPIFALHIVGVWNITMGLLKNGMWIQNLDLDISLTALNIEEPNSLVGHSYSTLQFTIGCASCSIFQEYEDDPEDDDYYSLGLSSCFLDMLIVHVDVAL